MERIVFIILNLAAIYLLCGLVFAIPFVVKGVIKIDPDGTKGTKLGFRLIIIPGSVVFWPILLRKWIRASKNQHDQTAA